MRWAQMGFVEDDPGITIRILARLLQEHPCRCGYPERGRRGRVLSHANSLPLSQQVARQHGHIRRHLQKSCRKLGMNVVARTDAHACHQDVYDAHPDWIAVDASGNKRHPSDPDFWLTCALGPYNFEFMTSVHQEIMTKYMVDGIFTNRWAGSGMCYCEHCQKNFRDFSGLDLPRTLNPQDPARRAVHRVASTAAV